MQGLRLSQLFFEEAAAPLLRKKLNAHWQRLAFGLVGEGSECFGFDDKISRDHDFGAGFCIWLPQEDMPSLAPFIHEALCTLPHTFMGFPVRPHLQEQNQHGGQRLGLFSIEDFYRRFTNAPVPPQTWQEWYLIPEHFLAVCTNGAVFYDGLGAFSAFRQSLLNFYPEDVRKKKLAARLAVMAQSGQYNLLRLLEREDTVGVTLTYARFIENALAAFFLLHKRYMPFYKWAFKTAQNLPQGKAFTDLILKAQQSMTAQNDKSKSAINAMEEICLYMMKLLQAQGLSTSDEPWLMEQAEHVQSSITVPQLRSLPLSHGVHYS